VIEAGLVAAAVLVAAGAVCLALRRLERRLCEALAAVPAAPVPAEAQGLLDRIVGGLPPRFAGTGVQLAEEDSIFSRGPTNGRDIRDDLDR
jgi:hypothetical protein